MARFDDLPIEAVRETWQWLEDPVDIENFDLAEYRLPGYQDHHLTGRDYYA